MTDTAPTGAAPAAPAKKPAPSLETRTVLAILSTLLMAAAFGLPWFVKPPEGSLQMLGDMKGAIILQWGLVMGWYFGSSKGSAAKDDTIAALTKQG